MFASQAGGLAALQPEGFAEMMRLVSFYKENAEILKKCFQEMGFKARATLSYFHSRPHLHFPLQFGFLFKYN